MATERKVLARKGSHLVPLPATIRQHLGTAPGVTVYWRASRDGEATLSMRDRPARGPERGDRECPSCAAYRKEIERLRARIAQRPAAAAREGYAQGRQDEMRATIRLGAEIAEVRKRVDQVLTYVRPAPRRRSARTARAIEAAPSPVLAGESAATDTPAQPAPASS